MIWIELFLTFLKIGAFTFGGDYHRTLEIRSVNDMLNRRKELHVMASYRFEEGIYLLSPTLAK